MYSFAAHTETQRFGKPQRNRLDRTKIARNVLADKTVSPRRAKRKRAVFICQSDRKTVDLRLYGIQRIRRGHFHARKKLIKLLKRKNIRKTAHLNPMRYFDKFVEHLSADAPRRRISIVKLRICRFQFL